ncbi:MAG: triple tyrosine motif-containing protein [Chitinophagaceae bacterium]
MFLLLMLNMIAGFAQTLPNRRYTTRDGLVADRITVITQDQDGFMWMGSLFGLSRYDGTRFITITLPSSQQYKYVTALLAADHKVYAGFLFGGGLMEYDKGRVTAHHIRSDQKRFSNDITAVADDANGILVANSLNQVFRFSNGKFNYIFSLDTSFASLSIASMSVDKKGRIWLATAKGLLIFENGIITTPLGNEPVLFISNTGKGMMVARTTSNKTTIELYDEQLHGTMLWQTGYVRQIPFTGSYANSFWGIDAKRGLFRLSPSGQLDFFASAAYIDPEIKYLFADRENNLWMAIDPGVLKISNVPALSYEFAELAPGGADITRGKDSITWCTNSKYLYLVKNNQLIKAQEFRTGKAGGYLGALMVDDENNLWVSGWDKGLWKLKYKNEKLVSQQYIDSYRNQVVNINCMAHDELGNTWMAGNHGIFHIRNGAIQGRYIPKAKNGDTAFITAIAVDVKKQQLWLGHNTNGLIRLAYTTQGNTFSYTPIDYFDKEQGLTDTYIRSVLFDAKENLWIGTRLGGIFRMRSKKDGSFLVQHYGSANGISCTRVTDIAEEKGTAIWFATCGGIFRFSLASESWQSYSASDGLLAAEVFSLSVDQKNKRVWAVSGQGITNLLYQGADNRPAPQVNITQISILGKEDTAALLQQHPKKLSADESSVGFTFAGTSYIDEKKIRYKYMLEGYDKEWSVPVQNNNVSYASLPFGHYTFKVVASNGDRWSEQPASFAFQVVRPFYKSAWFIALMAGLLGLSFYFVRIYQLKQKLKLEKLRVNIARDLHDDIGSALGSINLLSENARRGLGVTKSVEEVSGVFQKIGYSAQSVLDSMDDIIWTINPEKDSLEDLLIRMREFAIPLLEAKNISFDINMNATEGVKPSMEIKRNIYLVFKEAIFNVVRHSGSTHVAIHASFGSRSFDLSISDNGKGFIVNTSGSRNGLKNMKKRADLSGGSLAIESVPGSGTTIKFHGIIR